MKRIILAALVGVLVSGCGPALFDVMGIDPRTVKLTFPVNTDKAIGDYISTIPRREITLNKKFVLFIPDEKASNAFIDSSPY